MKKITVFIISFLFISFVGAQTGFNFSKAFKSAKASQVTNGEMPDTTGYITAANSSLGSGYPFLSSDGLRLYFVSNPVDNPADTLYSLYSVSRSSKNQAFANKKLVSTTIYKNAIYGLTNDELELYSTSDGFDMTTGSLVDSIFVQKRNSINDQFGSRVFSNKFGLKNGLLTSMSFSPDKSEVIATAYIIDFNTFNLSTRIVRLKKNQNVYNYYDSIPVGGKLHPYTGQLTKDGLSYYVSMFDDYESPTFAYMYVMKRNKLTDKFTVVEDCHKSMNLFQYNFFVSYSSDMSSNVKMVSSDPSGSWETCRLVSSENTITSAPIINSSDISFFPNPAKNELHISGVGGQMQICIYDAGLLLVKKIQTSDSIIDISSLPAGVYSVVIDCDNQTYVKKLIKH